MRVDDITTSTRPTKKKSPRSISNVVMARRVAESEAKETCELNSHGKQEQVDPYLHSKKLNTHPIIDSYIISSLECLCGF